MLKWITRILLLFVTLVAISIFFLSFYGWETNYFNSTIQEKAKKLDNNLNLDFEKTNILLDLKKLELKVKIRNPRIILNNKSTDLSKLNLNISIKHIIKNKGIIIL